MSELAFPQMIKHDGSLDGCSIQVPHTLLEHYQCAKPVMMTGNRYARWLLPDGTSVVMWMYQGRLHGAMYGPEATAEFRNEPGFTDMEIIG